MNISFRHSIITLIKVSLVHSKVCFVILIFYKTNILFAISINRVYLLILFTEFVLKFFSGDPDLKVFQTRFKIWQSQEESCSGKWHNFICNLGSGDLSRVVNSRQMFVNKFRYEEDPIAFECMEKWYNKRVLNGVNDDFDIEFYKKQPWVSYHV